MIGLRAIELCPLALDLYGCPYACTHARVAYGTMTSDVTCSQPAQQRK